MFALGNRHRLIRILFAGIVILLFAVMFLPFFTPLLLAALFAFALENGVTKLTLRFKNRKLVTAAVLLALLFFVLAPIIAIVLKTVASIKDYASVGLQNTQIYQLTEKLFLSLTQTLTDLAQRFEIDLSQLPHLNDLLGQGSSLVAASATNLVTQLPQWALAIFVFVIGLYYFLTESRQIKNFFLKLDLLSKVELNQVITIVKKSSYLTLFASALIGSLQALIVASFGYFCGFTEFILLFVVTFIFSLVPVIGAAPIAVFLAILSFIQGHNGSGVALLIAAAVAGSIDNVIKPLIVNASSSDDLHPVVSLLALIGAIIVYGAAGILLGPILTQLAFNITGILFPQMESNESSE